MRDWVLFKGCYEQQDATSLLLTWKLREEGGEGGMKATSGQSSIVRWGPRPHNPQTWVAMAACGKPGRRFQEASLCVLDRQAAPGSWVCRCPGQPPKVSPAIHAEGAPAQGRSLWMAPACPAEPVPPLTSSHRRPAPREAERSCSRVP